MFDVYPKREIKKMIIDMLKQDGAFLPSLDEDVKKCKRYKNGDVFTFEIKRKRNGKFHRKCMALIQFVYDNQEKYETRKHFVAELKLLTGHYDEHVSINREMRYIPKSISYEALDEDGFAAFYNEVINACMKYFMEGMTSEEINQRVDAILAGWD